MGSIVHDIREAVRVLRKQPRFLFISSLTLALGIGAVTSIFSVVNGVLLKPLLYPHADRLVSIAGSAPGLGYDRFPLSPDLFMFYQRTSSAFDDMTLFQRRRANLTQTGSPEVVDLLVTTHRYFTTLGVGFQLGRSYTAEEDRPEAARVAVVSHRLLMRKYGGDRALLSRTIPIDGELSQVVGVAPAWLDQPNSPDVWIPARFDPANYASSVAELVAEPRLMGLDAGEPNRTAFDRLSALEAGRLLDGHAVRDREMAKACLAGLWLYHDFLDQSHRISQGLHGREGSYWHGIMHRREGDFANAKYWLRRVDMVQGLGRQVCANRLPPT